MAPEANRNACPVAGWIVLNRPANGGHPARQAMKAATPIHPVTTAGIKSMGSMTVCPGNASMIV